MRDSPGSIVILYAISITGMISNAWAFRTIYTTRYMHNAFGVFCTILAIANFVAMLIFFFVMALPIYKVFGDQIFDELPGKIIGQLGLFCLYNCEYAHIAISFNRLVHIAFPLKGWKFFSRRVTSVAVVLIYAFTLMEVSPYFSRKQLADQCYFSYDVNASLWNFADTECGRFCADYIERISSITILSVIFSMDVIAFLLFRRHRLHEISNSDKNRKIEKRLFLQSICQVVPLFCAILTFQLISVTQKYSAWGLFLSNTVSWGMVHAMDGLVLVAFHSKVLVKISNKLQKIAPSRSSDISAPPQLPANVTLTTVASSRVYRERSGGRA